MSTPRCLFMAVFSALSLLSAQPESNPQIDYSSFRIIVNEMESDREQKRLDEEQFLKAMESGEYVLLDARSARFYAMRHIKGAVNLPFTEFTEETLAEVIPNKDSKVLIYCNNNFSNNTIDLRSKMPATSLNLSTQSSLRGYGYKNIYELRPIIDFNKTKLPMAGTEMVQSANKLQYKKVFPES